jgi:methyl-accepting chemotaxis protein
VSFIINHISAKMLATILAGLLLTVLSVTGVGLWSEHRLMMAQAQRSAAQFTQLIAVELAPGLHLKQADIIQRKAQTYIKAFSDTLANLATYDAEANRLTDYQSPALAGVSMDNLLAQERQRVEQGETVIRIEDAQVVAIVPAVITGTTTRGGFVAAAWSLSPVQAQLLASAKISALTGLFLLVLGLVTIGAMLRWLVSTPLKHITQTLGGLAAGQADIAIPYRQRGDELGQMARALDVFKTAGQRLMSLQKEREEAEERQQQERAHSRLEMALLFEQQFSHLVSHISSATQQLQASSTQLSTNAQESLQHAKQGLGAVEETASNVDNIAAATEELGASAGEIGRQVGQASQVAQSAVNQVRQTREAAAGLAQAATRIGEVSKLIADIASQTNLLALNATIEAARAGEMGRGFAVVAGEVKNLANQTGGATDEINQHIMAMQNGAQAVVRAIGTIGEVIGEIDRVSSGIASAVEQQGAATREIGRNITHAAQGARGALENITAVRSMAQHNSGGLAEIVAAVSQVGQDAHSLQQAATRFVAHVRNS